MASGATCVQKLDGSRDSAIHTTYRISLRSSSMREPRYPLPRVIPSLFRATGARHSRGPKPAVFRCTLASIPRRVLIAEPSSPAGREGPRGRGGTTAPESSVTVRASSYSGIDNDPSAGSPTETLLRLLLPLNDKVQWTSRDVAGFGAASGQPVSPRSEHFTGPFNR